MAKIKLTKNELKVQKDALKMYRRYLPTLTLKKQQLQSEIRTIEAKAKAVLKEKENLEKGFGSWIAVFSESDAFPEGIITVSNIRKGEGNIAGVAIPTFEGADFLIYGLGKEWYLENEQIPAMKASEFLSFARESGAFIVQAHPFREARYIDHIHL